MISFGGKFAKEGEGGERLLRAREGKTEDLLLLVAPKEKDLPFPHARSRRGKGLFLAIAEKRGGHGAPLRGLRRGGNRGCLSATPLRIKKTMLGDVSLSPQQLMRGRS